MSKKETFELEPHVMAAIAGVEAARSCAIRDGVIVSPLSYTVDEKLKPNQP